ncbi:MAG: acylphosphatase [Solobacterium sp.]|nr:acylphosphatase [Solobacterium sp.]
MKRYHVIVEGQVQGVGFRGFVTLQAQKRRLTGSVKNMSNGMVEIFVQGEEADIDSFLAAVAKGDGRFIRVDDITVKPTEVKPDEKRFSYGWF